MATKYVDRDAVEARIALGRRIKEARQSLGMSGRGLGKLLGVSHSFISQLENGQSGLTTENMARLSSILGVQFTEYAELVTGASNYGRSQMVPEGEKIDIRKLKSGDAELLKSMMAGKKAEVWLLTSENISAAFHPGEYLIVDVATPARAKDIVLAEVDGVPVFRLFYPPNLVAIPAGTPAPASIKVDRNRVIIKGVVTPRAIKF